MPTKKTNGKTNGKADAQANPPLIRAKDYQRAARPSKKALAVMEATRRAMDALDREEEKYGKPKI